MSPGTYFNPSSNEIAAVGSSQDDRLPAGDGWIKVSDNPRLALLPVRDLLVRQGLVQDALLVYWYGFRGSAQGRDKQSLLELSPGAHAANARPPHSSIPILSRAGDIVRAVFRIEAATRKGLDQQDGKRSQVQ